MNVGPDGLAEGLQNIGGVDLQGQPLLLVQLRGGSPADDRGISRVFVCNVGRAERFVDYCDLGLPIVYRVMVRPELAFCT